MKERIEIKVKVATKDYYYYVTFEDGSELSFVAGTVGKLKDEEIKELFRRAGVPMKIKSVRTSTKEEYESITSTEMIGDEKQNNNLIN